MAEPTRRRLGLDAALGVGFAIVQLAWFVFVNMALYLLGGMDGYSVISTSVAIAIMFAPSLGLLVYAVVARARRRRAV